MCLNPIKHPARPNREKAAAGSSLQLRGQGGRFAVRLLRAL